MTTLDKLRKYIEKLQQQEAGNLSSETIMMTLHYNQLINLICNPTTSSASLMSHIKKGYELSQDNEYGQCLDDLFGKGLLRLREILNNSEPTTGKAIELPKQKPNKSASHHQFNNITEYPDEVQLKIFSQLSAQDLGNVAQVCNTWNGLSSDASLWQHRLREDFPQQQGSVPATAETAKKQYQYNVLRPKMIADLNRLSITQSSVNNFVSQKFESVARNTADVRNAQTLSPIQRGLLIGINRFSEMMTFVVAPHHKGKAIMFSNALHQIYKLTHDSPTLAQSYRTSFEMHATALIVSGLQLSLRRRSSENFLAKLNEIVEKNPELNKLIQHMNKTYPIVVNGIAISFTIYKLDNILNSIDQFHQHFIQQNPQSLQIDTTAQANTSTAPRMQRM